MFIRRFLVEAFVLGSTSQYRPYLLVEFWYFCSDERVTGSIDKRIIRFFACGSKSYALFPAQEANVPYALSRILISFYASSDSKADEHPLSGRFAEKLVM
jgi:hypothetical protein